MPKKKKKNQAAAALVGKRWSKTTKKDRLKVGQDLARARKRARAAREQKTQK